MPPLFQSAQSANNLLLGGFECKVVVTNSSVFVERSIEGHIQPQATKILPYLFIKECKIVPTVNKAYRDNATSKHPDACRTEKDEQCLYFMILNKNVVVQAPSFANPTSLLQTCSFAAQALVHTNADLLTRSPCESDVSHKTKNYQRDALSQPLQVAINFALNFYSFINNGCLYSLSLRSQPASSAAQATESSSKLPTLKSLNDEPCIDVTSDFKVEFLSFPFPAEKTPLDVTDLISKVFLPKFSTTTSLTKESRYGPK